MGSVDYYPSSWYYPTPPAAALKTLLVGKKLELLATPAAVIDRAKVKRNCDAMLHAVRELQIGFRAHVKTHKTVELTKLQVKDQLEQAPNGGAIKLVVSTVAEIEHLFPFLQEAKQSGNQIDVIYGVPPTGSSISQLLNLARVLDSSGPQLFPPFSILVDHPDQLVHLNGILNPEPRSSLGIFVKIDTGYHRAGVEVDSKRYRLIISSLEACLEDHAQIRFRGLYTHLGNSYDGDEPEDAIDNLITEIEGVERAAEQVKRYARDYVKLTANRPLILSVGATPTATAAQNLFYEKRQKSEALDRLRSTIRRITSEVRFRLELHAGVYSLLDMQQVAAHARPAEVDQTTPGSSGLSVDNLALRILVKVASLYPERPKPEALVAAGTLALGREPCKSYPGYAVVTPWKVGDLEAIGVPDDGLFSTDVLRDKKAKYRASGFDVYDPDAKTPTGWIVGKVSQEHGILTWEGQKDKMRELTIGEKLLLWPNHACIASAGFGWYVVVDSDTAEPDVVRDIWVRCRGW